MKEVSLWSGHCLPDVKDAYRSLHSWQQVYALAALSDHADTATFHIVRYHQAWMEEHRLYIQTELCTSTLSNEMNQGPLTEDRRYKFLREICLALEFIHKNGMVHLDIKPETIFVSQKWCNLPGRPLLSFPILILCFCSLDKKWSIQVRGFWSCLQSIEPSRCRRRWFEIHVKWNAFRRSWRLDEKRHILTWYYAVRSMPLW